jgi:putative ABC transport system ATP-binding protein
MIKLERVTKDYHMGENVYHALRGIDIEVKAGEMVAIVGPSGSGKTTTMNIIGLLDKPSSGCYVLNGRDVSSLSSDEQAYWRNREIGFVFQSFFLLPRLTALQNVMLPLNYRQVPAGEKKERAMASLAKVGMDRHSHHRPTELSGGQQQRVAIARALIGEPSIILADEPTGALDSKTSREVMDLLMGLNQQEQRTVVMITHDPDLARECPRDICIYDGMIVDELPRHI